MYVNERHDPHGMAYQVAKDNRETVLGQKFILRYLTSERGKKMNGKHCTVIGADPDLFFGRYHCRIDSEPVVMKVKICNLAYPASAILHEMAAYSVDDLPTPAELLPRIEQVIIWGLNVEFNEDSRADAIHRIEVMKRYHSKMIDDNPSLINLSSNDPQFRFVAGDKEDRMDPTIIPCGDNRYFDRSKKNLTADEEEHYKVMYACRFACCGNGTVDFRRFTFGLCGGSHIPECSICTDEIEKTDRLIIKFPCQHIFHDKCISEWIEDLNHNDCPTCRQPMPVKSMHDAYRLDYDEYFQLRLQEFIMSGFCEKCQSYYIERDPIMSVTQDGFSEFLSMSQLKM